MSGIRWFVGNYMIHRNLVVALLTFILITTVLPASAKYSSSHDPTSLPHSQSLPPMGEVEFSTALNPQKEPQTLLERGKQLYKAGRFAEAARLWEAVRLERSGGRDLALSYSYLAIVYQDLGRWEAAREAIAQVNLLQTDDPILHARVLNTQGILQLNIGHAEAALETWKQAETSYRSLKDVTGTVLSQINQAQALQTLGLYRRARATLEQVNRDLAPLPDSLLKVRELRSLGVTLQVVGDLQQSQAVLSQSLDMARRLNSTADIGEALLGLGNTARAMANFEAALQFYQQVKDTATPRTQLEAQLNQLSLLVKTEQTAAAQTLLSQIQARLANSPPSRDSIYAQVNLAESMIRMGSREWGVGSRGGQEMAQIDSSRLTQHSALLLATAVRQARELNDPRAESYALGQLGHLYEQTQQWPEALSLTDGALALAQEIRAASIAATWHWQQGRILKAQGDVKSAIAAYEAAVETLASLRQDLVAVNPDVQFSFREQVEPVYRQLVQLLLQDVDRLPVTTRQQHLQRSRSAIEALQLAELENFFREACLTYKPRQIDEIDSKAAVIYPILLDRRLEVILSLPGQPLQHYGTALSPEEGESVFEELRQSLNPAFLPAEVLPPAQKLYDWLLRPARLALERQGIETLVFVLDGFLRSLPMAVLHDGKQYLVEQYNIALTPGLQLLESPSSPKRFRILAGGLTEPRQGFSALPGVEQEIEQIAATVSTQVLIDAKFTRPNFQKRVDAAPFSIVHLATHGQFSSKAEDTFLLTWDDRINVKDLERLLRGEGGSANLRDRQPIELLVLSACQTAKGDDRAALGLAGVAVRSGARSTLATLWSVQDLSTAQLIDKFYHTLTQTGTTKAEALRQAQLSLLDSPQYQHPYYWSPFVLVGNWR